MLIGYMRVSTDDQKLDLQKDALTKAGCEQIYQDIASGGKTDRDGLADAISHLRAGDTLIVWKLDRLGRKIKDLIQFAEDFAAKKIELKSLTESIDTNTATGKLYFNLLCMLADFERNQLRERTKAGLEAARARGRKGGNKFKLNPNQLIQARKMYESKAFKVGEIAKQFNVCERTMFRALKPKTADQKK